MGVVSDSFKNPILGSLKLLEFKNVMLDTVVSTARDALVEEAIRLGCEVGSTLTTKG